MRKFSDYTELIIIFLIAAIGFGYFSSYADANTESRLSLVKALVEEKRFEIDTYQLNMEFTTLDRAFYNGHYYSDKAIGSSLIGAALYLPVRWIAARLDFRLTKRLFRQLMTFLAVSLLAACLAPLLYSFVSHLGGKYAAVWVTIGLIFGTGIYKYSTAYYGHVQAGLFLFAAYLIWYRARQSGVISYPWAFVSGFLLGWMVITEYPTALLAVILGIYLLIVLAKLKRLQDWMIYLVIGVGGLLPLSLFFYYNYQVYGTLFSLGYQHQDAAQFAAAHSQGLMGIGLPDVRVMFDMTFQPLMGIFWQSPILFLAFVGWFYLFKQKEYRAEFWFSISTIGLYLILISGYYMWWGGWAYTPRHLIPILPLFAIPLAFLPRKWLILGWLAALVSIAQSLIAVSAYLVGIGPFLEKVIINKYVIAPGSMIYDVFLPNFLANNLVNNRGSWFGLESWSVFLPLFLAEAVLLGLLFWLISRKV